MEPAGEWGTLYSSSTVLVFRLVREGANSPSKPKLMNARTAMIGACLCTRVHPCRVAGRLVQARTSGRPSSVCVLVCRDPECCRRDALAPTSTGGFLSAGVPSELAGDVPGLVRGSNPKIVRRRRSSDHTLSTTIRTFAPVCDAGLHSAAPPARCADFCSYWAQAHTQATCSRRSAGCPTLEATQCHHRVVTVSP